jgi:hypothetical protein
MRSEVDHPDLLRAREHERDERADDRRGAQVAREEPAPVQAIRGDSSEQREHDIGRVLERIDRCRRESRAGHSQDQQRKCEPIEPVADGRDEERA